MVSIIITVRERYAATEESISSILSALDDSVEVVFVAGKAPPEVLAFLRRTSLKRKRFRWIAEGRHLLANEARNIGLKKIKPKNDVVFIENDVVVRRNWLRNILRCARETQADIIAPLIFEGDPSKPDLRFHVAGADFKPKKNPNEMEIKHYLNHEEHDWKKLRRQAVDLVEFHCVFVRRKLLNEIGLDPEFDTLTAHVDLCFGAKKVRAKVVVEPKAHVVFLNPELVPIRNRWDFECFTDKWSEKNCRDLIAYSAKKWGMSPNGYFLWMFRYWSLWNKGLIFSSFGLLTGIELFLWRAIRVKFCPEWVRTVLEKYLVMRIRTSLASENA